MSNEKQSDKAAVRQNALNLTAPGEKSGAEIGDNP